MPTRQQKMFIQRLCPHRGLGKENTCESVEAAISESPFMVEFDVQLYRHSLHLGHPPVVNTESTLKDTLQLFRNSPVMPKIDLKLSHQTYDEALSALAKDLAQWSPHKSLVTFDGSLDADSFMEAESTFLRKTDKQVLLNVDLCKYKNKKPSDISQHIQTLARKPFSLSPNLDDDINYAIKFARQHQIPHIHFWSFSGREYSLEYLYKAMDLGLKSGLEVYFDIKYQNIMRDSAAPVLLEKTSA